MLASANNSFTGSTQLLAGTLRVAVPDFFGATPQALTINFGTAFDIGGFNQHVTTLTVVDGSVLNGAGNNATLNGTAFAVQNGLINASLSGTGTLTKTSSTGIITLAATNSYTGGTAVNAGTLVSGVTGAIPSGGSITIGGGTLDIGATNVTASSVTFSNGGLLGTGTVTGTSFLANGSQTFTVSTVLAGAGATLTKATGTAGVDSVTNGGTLTLTNNNTYTGATVIGPSGAGTQLMGGTVIVSTLANGGTISGIGASGNAASNLVITNGQLIYVGTGANTDRLFTIGAGSFAGILSSGTGSLNFTNTGAISTPGGGTLDLDGTFAGVNTFSPDITGNTNLLKQNSTEWQILGTRGYSGTTTIQKGNLTVDTLANGTQPSSIGVSDSGSGNLLLTGGTLKYIGPGASTDRLFSVNGSSGASIDSSGAGPLVFTNTGQIVQNSSPNQGIQARQLTLTGNNTGINIMMPQLVDGGGTLILGKSGSGFWKITNNNTYTGGTTVSAGTLLTTTNFSNGTLTVTGGTAIVSHQAGINDGSAGMTYLLMNTNGGTASTNNAFNNSTLTISGTGKLDLNNNGMVLDYLTPDQDSAATSPPTSPISTVKSLLVSGAASGSWTGATGISSSDAAASQTSGHPMALGYAEASAITATTIGGRSLDGTDVVVAYTYAGDSNLDGVVDTSDFMALAQNFGKHGSSTTWMTGDFNYDSVVNALDFNLVASNFGAPGRVYRIGAAGAWLGCSRARDAGPARRDRAAGDPPAAAVSNSERR